MDKLDPKTDGATVNIVEQNVEKLKELFPDLFTENKIDFGALRETLGDYIDDRQERYSFTWNGKSRARRIAQTPSTGTLRPCPEESVNWDSTQNLFIEGDNLEVLKLLQKSYHKKVKMIYIDPPYNTGKDFIYPDNFRDNIKNYLELTGQTDEGGRRLSANAETSGRYHTDWLNMMYPRLKLARNLLRDDGVIFISIDDCEVANLRKLCDEIFGEENFVAQLIWKGRQFPDSRSLTHVSTDHEYILIYSKFGLGVLRGVERDESKFKNPDNDSRGPWMSRSILGLATKEQRPNLHYNIIDPATNLQYVPAINTGWRYSKERMEELIKTESILFPPKPDGRPREKKFRKDLVDEYTSFPSIISDVYTAHGTSEIRSMFKFQAFEFPKPTELIRRLVEQGTQREDIVLDFFSGSSATAESVIKQNMIDGGERKWVCVQLPESTGENSEVRKQGYCSIAEIGKERIRRVIKNIEAKQAEKTKEGQEALPGLSEEEADIDLGFKVLKLDSSNIKLWEADFDTLEQDLMDAVDNIKSERSETDVLYELLLKYGLDLTVPIEERKIDRKTVYIVGAGALIVCLAKAISLDVVEGIAALKGELKPEIMRVVFKDAGFKDDVVKTNAVQILKQAGIDDVKSL